MKKYDPRSGARSEQTRRRLVDAAIKLYAEKGADATTIQDISDEAGENTGLIYYYFNNKQDLFTVAMVESIMGAASGVLAAEVMEKGGPEEHLDRLFNAYFDLIDENPRVAMIAIRGLLEFMGEGEVPFGGIMFDRVSVLEKIVREGQKSGEFTNVNPTAAGYAFIAIAFSYFIANQAAEKPLDPAIPQTSRKDYLKLLHALVSGMRA